MKILRVWHKILNCQQPYLLPTHTLPQGRLEDIQRSVVLASSQDVQFVVDETDAVPEPGRFRELGEWPPLYASDQTVSTMEPLGEPQGLAGNPLHEFIIDSVPTNQDQDLKQGVRYL